MSKYIVLVGGTTLVGLDIFMWILNTESNPNQNRWNQTESKPTQILE